MASIQVIKNKTSKKYRIQFMKNGKRVSKRFDKKKDAELFLGHLTISNNLADIFTSHIQTSLTLEKACSEYAEQYTGKCTSTLQRVNWWAKEYKSLTINKVNKQRIRATLRKLANDMAPATVNRYKASLSAVFTYLQDEHDFANNPAREVKQLAENNARCRYLSDDERVRLLEAAKVSGWDRLYMLVIMALTTGARRSDLLRLTWQDIDFKSKTASVTVTKNGDPRILPLTDIVISEMVKFREVGACFVFPHPSKLSGFFRNFDCYWNKALRTAKLNDFRFHDLRHTAASYLAMANVSQGQIAEILGQKTLNVTQRYIHLSTGHKSKVINKVLGGIASG